MESKGEKDIEAFESLIPGVKVTLSHTEGVTQVKSAVHIWERKSLKELGLLMVGLDWEIVVSFPDVSGSLLYGNEFVSTGSAFHLLIDVFAK